MHAAVSSCLLDIRRAFQADAPSPLECTPNRRADLAYIRAVDAALFFSGFANLSTPPLQGAGGEVLARPTLSLARVGQVLQQVRRVARHEQEAVSASGLRAAVS